MSQAQYAGRILNGPWAGRILAHHYPEYELQVYEKSILSFYVHGVTQPTPAGVKPIRYRWGYMERLPTPAERKAMPDLSFIRLDGWVVARDKA